MRMTLEQRHQHQAALRAAATMISHLDQGITALIDQRAAALAAHIAGGATASGFTSSIDTELSRYRSALASVESGNPSADAIALCGSAVSTQAAPTTPLATAATGSIDSRIAALEAEQARLLQRAGGQHSSPRPTEPTAPAARHADNGAQAASEWDANFDNCNACFRSKERYVAYRKAVLDGRHIEPTKKSVVTI